MCPASGQIDVSERCEVGSDLHHMSGSLDAEEVNSFTSGSRSVWRQLSLPRSSDSLSRPSSKEETNWWWGGRRRLLPLRLAASPPGEAVLRHGDGATVLRGERCCACSQTTVSVLKEVQLKWWGGFRVPSTGDKLRSIWWQRKTKRRQKGTKGTNSRHSIVSFLF